MTVCELIHALEDLNLEYHEAEIKVATDDILLQDVVDILGVPSSNPTNPHREVWLRLK